MKFRQLFNSIIGRNNLNTEDSNPVDSASNGLNAPGFDPDPLGQNYSELAYPLDSPRVVHTEEYNAALKIAGEFDQLESQEERLAFWDAHFKVFGPACIIVFDTEEEVYWPYYGRIQDRLFEDLNGNDERYKSYSILPNDIEEFWPFVNWSIPKYRNVEGLTIMDEKYYWKRIKQNLSPADFLNKLLEAAEAHRDHINGIQKHWVFEEVSADLARQYFFYYGNQIATEGDLGGLSGPTFNLSLVLRKIPICPLPEYGEIFFHYYDGYHTALMVAFLKKQKRRLEREGEEDIKYPVAQEVYKNTSCTTLEADGIFGSDCSSQVKKNLSSEQGLDQLGNLADSFVDAFIDIKSAPELVQKLQRMYKEAKAGQYSYMLYALYDLGFIADPSSSNRTKLHNQLKTTFGEVGTRQNLNANINRLNRPSQQESADIKAHKRKIVDFK